MAKRRSSPARTRGFSPKDLPNRKYVTVTWAAASTTAVYTSFDTMMGAREGAGWLITRVDLQWGGAVPPAFANSANQSWRFQLAVGSQTETLDPSDDEVICTIDWHCQLLTSGGYAMQFPLTWVGPVLVASKDLTCSMDAVLDSLPARSADMVFTIWYHWMELGAREWVDIAQARGIA